EHPEVVLVATKTYECDMDDTVRLPRRDFFEYVEGKVIRFEDTQSSAPFTLPSILFRKSLIDSIGGYDNRLCYSADLDFLARAALIGSIACLDDYLYVFRILPTSISGVGSRIQTRITDIIRAAGERAKKGVNRDFTQEEVNELRALAEEKQGLQRTPQRIKDASYEVRLATLFRVNGQPSKALLHSFQAIRIAPTMLFWNRKLIANVIKSLAMKS
ncbi:MAG: hypothetical protein KC964_30630, partial [Candidatus Omnitrophica bacterium]|nr:hypothetical protein [Candidatus Omnitrophota bacterium]